MGNNNIHENFIVKEFGEFKLENNSIVINSDKIPIEPNFVNYDDAPDNMLFINKKNKEIIGIIQYEMITKSCVHFMWVCISQKYRGRGYGKIIINNFLNKLPRPIKVEAEIRTSQLQKYFKSFGFGFDEDLNCSMIIEESGERVPQKPEWE